MAGEPVRRPAETDGASVPRGHRWLRFLVADAWLAVPLWVVLTRFDALRAGHPAYPVTLTLAFLVGAGLLARALRPVPVERRWPLVRALAAALVTVLACGVLAWLRPFSASATAVAAMSSPSVAVTQDFSSITLAPTTSDSGLGLIFQPGARVDPRAYVPLLERVADRGHRVVIVKQPFDLAFAALGAPSRVMDANPRVSRWVVGGHSLGGVAAARAAVSGDPRIAGLVLWASYPDSAVRDVPLPALSIYGTRDELASASVVRGAAEQLPRASFVAVEGGSHAYFGDYGEQPGDGVPTVSRDVAQRQIAAATADFLGELGN